MKTSSIIGIIPARFKSQRLPGKPLADILGKPLIYYVWRAASDSELLDKVLIATDDERIRDACKEFGAECILTPKNIKSGSDRVIFALNTCKENYDYIVNIQGDEPFITGQLIDELIKKTKETAADVGTVITRIKNNEEVFDESVVKVVLRSDDTALYFSRSPLPFLRDVPQAEWLDKTAFWKHIGIYCYSKTALARFGDLPQSELEKAEKLEQLRLLQDNAKYVCLQTDLDLTGVDTPTDLEKARTMMKEKLS